MNFAKIASPLTNRHKKEFQELKKWLTTAPTQTLPVESEKYTIYGDAFKNDLGCVLI